MKRWIRLSLPPALIVVSILVVVVLAMTRSSPEQREPVVAAMLVDVTEVEPSQERFKVNAQGTVRPRTETTLVAEVSGQIVRQSDAFAAGGFFRAGDVLAEIDPSDYRAALLQAEAELATARSVLADEQARSDQARRDWQRLHGSEREPNELVLRLPQLAGAQAAVQAREAAVLRARRNLERTRIRLPYDGMIRVRNVDIGQYVSAGTTLGVAFAVDVAEVRLPLSDRDLAFLDLPLPGQTAENPPEVILSATVSGEPGRWTGYVARTEGVVDEASRLTYVVTEIRDPYGLLEATYSRPLPMGTFVQAEIVGRDAAGLLVLPRAALRDGNTVYLANGDDRLEIRAVEVVRATPERVYVRNDIQPGERVITTAIQAPIPGLTLRVREALDQTPDYLLDPSAEYAVSDFGGEP